MTPRNHAPMVAAAVVATALLAVSPTQTSASTPPGGSAPPSAMPTAAAPTMPGPDSSGDQTPPVGANGVAIDPDGDLWIADGSGDQILEVAADSGEILSRWPTSAVLFPDDLVIDNEGVVYWTGMVFGLVGRIDPAAAENTVIATMPPGANPITFADDGSLLVGITLAGDALYRLDPSGSVDAELLAVDLGGINGFDVAPDGYLYAPRFLAGEVIRIDPADGTVVDVVASDLGNPGAVRATADGTLLVLRSAPSPTIFAVTPGADGADSVVEELIALPTDVADNFAIADDGTLFVTGFNKPVVFVVATNGTVTELPIGRE